MAGRRLPREPRAVPVDRRHLLTQAEGAQLHAVGAKRVGLDDVGAGTQIGGVHVVDQARVR